MGKHGRKNLRFHVLVVIIFSAFFAQILLLAAGIVMRILHQQVWMSRCFIGSGICLVIWYVLAIVCDR